VPGEKARNLLLLLAYACYPQKGKEMTTISGTTYANIYSYSSSNLSDELNADSSSSKETGAGKTAASGDSVTLSSEIDTAKKREYLGLSPTGRLSLSDVETAAAGQETVVNRMLSAAMAELGIDEDQAVTLSLDEDDNVVVEEDFQGKSELEDALNGDDAFVQAFEGLCANNEVTDYIDSLLGNTKSLFDYMGTDANDEDLMALATRYSNIKSGGASMETLWNMGRSETPYSYTYNS
jgi:hypothetical protein